MTHLPDSNQEHKDFFCSSCQNHKKGSLLSHKSKNRKYCTTCIMPVEEREKMGIANPYENTAKKRASIKQAGKEYSKTITDQALYAMTGENNDNTKPSETL